MLASVRASLAMLEETLPDSLVFGWLSASVLRRVGDLRAASAKLEWVAPRAEKMAAEARVPFYRVAYNRAQCLYCTLSYADVVEAMAPLVAADCRYTARAMCLMHMGAGLAYLGQPSRAREAFRQVEGVAKSGGGRLDAQLWQRAQVWLARGDADLPLAALELHLSVGYLRSSGMAAEERRKWAEHAEPILTTAEASSCLEPRLVASLLRGVLAIPEDAPAAVRLLTAANDGANRPEYVAGADQWVGCVAQRRSRALRRPARRQRAASAPPACTLSWRIFTPTTRWRAQALCVPRARHPAH